MNFFIVFPFFLKHLVNKKYIINSRSVIIIIIIIIILN